MRPEPGRCVYRRESRPARRFVGPCPIRSATAKPDRFCLCEPDIYDNKDERHGGDECSPACNQWASLRALARGVRGVELVASSRRVPARLERTRLRLFVVVFSRRFILPCCIMWLLTISIARLRLFPYQCVRCFFFFWALPRRAWFPCLVAPIIRRQYITPLPALGHPRDWWPAVDQVPIPWAPSF